MAIMNRATSMQTSRIRIVLQGDWGRKSHCLNTGLCLVLRGIALQPISQGVQDAHNARSRLPQGLRGPQYRSHVSNPREAVSSLPLPPLQKPQGPPGVVLKRQIMHHLVRRSDCNEPGLGQGSRRDCGPVMVESWGWRLFDTNAIVHQGGYAVHVTNQYQVTILRISECCQSE